MSHVDYDCQAEKWSRDTPRNLSDFIARPQLIQRVTELGGDVIDAGCGEGYVSRRVVSSVTSVTGFDKSEGMIEQAIKREKENPQGIDYFVSDMKNVFQIPDESFDVYMSSLALHYFNPEELEPVYGQAHRILRNDGSLVAIMISDIMVLSLKSYPNPAVELKNPDKLFNYNKSVGEFYPVILTCEDGTKMDVGVIHSRMKDHFGAFCKAGFKLKNSQDIVVPSTVPDFFKGLTGIRLYTYLELKK